MKKYIILAKIVAYSGLLFIDIFLLNTFFSLIREPDTALNYLGLFLMFQGFIGNIIIIHFFNKTIKSISKNENNKN